ncbi:hypothetical protein StoSoilA2_22550 [Arthrobacter sp. StoSoilA2]|uniref:DUF6766 family protein n=1 Tax=unclassified Arthrobacter TaxID=235627 RepID=UPI001CC4A17A|nr:MULTISPECIES: DUF6766 family protein [unclassified Arthrobacter]MDR6685271.1 hypothetical protein [Arthrobacter sp. 1088]BCW36199.1 hypothetical protein StoSoilA2_22550 [Arthrobacter sp. StoSoilA2]
MKKALRNNGLSLFFGLIFILALAGQAITGQAVFNEDQLTAGLDEITFLQYITSSSFAVDVSENWQSEYLQFLLYITATIWLLQKGSPESKELDKPGLESDEEQLVGEHANAKSPAWAKAKGWRLTVFSNSLAATMGLIFILSWLVQSITGHVAFNEEQLRNFQEPLSWAEYLVSPDFWNRTLQNWQSEFLAVGSMVVLSIYLRQRGSPESKPVGAAHDATGTSG